MSAKSTNNNSVSCVRLKSQAGGGSGYEEATISRDDNMLDTAPAPGTQRSGFPLVILRRSTVSGLANDDNQHPTYGWMIDPNNGLASPV
ncbi:MAG: hypothetical protein Q9166_000437 [cf. Caloplaca sp. 2 TL-2023]